METSIFAFRHSKRKRERKGVFGLVNMVAIASASACEFRLGDEVVSVTTAMASV
jgi:hypothetical protein